MAAKKKTEKVHGCIDKINKALEARNGVLFGGISINLATGKPCPPRIYIAVDKLESKSRMKPPHLGCSYCPFCGKEMPR